MQVRWDDQSQYHQGLESVFVGARLSALPTTSAEKQFKRIPVTTRGTHTLTNPPTDNTQTTETRLCDSGITDFGTCTQYVSRD